MLDLIKVEEVGGEMELVWEWEEPIYTLPEDSDSLFWDGTLKEGWEGYPEGTNVNDIDLTKADASNVIIADSMFRAADWFRQNIGHWNMSNVISCRFMFRQAHRFNSDIGRWDVSQVKDVYWMFSESLFFNRDIGSWDTSSIENMRGMFLAAHNFNQDIGQWNTFNVTDMGWMLRDAFDFNQDISWKGGEIWNVSNVEDMSTMLNNSSLSTENYDKFLIGLKELDQSAEYNLQTEVELGALGIQFGETTEAVDAHDYLTSQLNWTIIDDGPVN